MTEITLTKNQLESIKNDMKGVEMLKPEEVNALAQKVNKAVNLPFIKEEKEFIVFAKVIQRVDRALYQLLPNEYYLLVKDSSDGISKEEAIVLEERLTELINNVVNIPILTENMERKLISVILGLIIKAMVKGFKLEEAELAND